MAPIDGGPSGRKAYIVTGPTAGIGRQTALDLARHGTVVLVGRDPGRLDSVRQTIGGGGGGRRAVPVLCDLSDPASVRRAAARIIELGLPVAGLVNNAGIMQLRPTTNAHGWDMTFATDHLGPFALTEALAPHLQDGAQVVFVCSGVEDPERRFAVMAGFPAATPMPPPSSATWRRCWRSRARCRGCALTRSSLASARGPILAGTAMWSCAW
jgi:NAD(P)-dependent dehydrogenase (short-subunit alcohol dehydrogenase family)